MHCKRSVFRALKHVREVDRFFVRHERPRQSFARRDPQGLGTSWDILQKSLPYKINFSMQNPMKDSTKTSRILLEAELLRSHIVSVTTEDVREEFAQYLTPYQTARLAASMFSDARGGRPLRCLDLGAGTGILSAALLERYAGAAEVAEAADAIELDCVELDPKLAALCDAELARVARRESTRNPIRHGIRHRVLVGDALTMSFPASYDRVILNPPYRKMAASDPRQRGLPAKSPNLYCAFLMKALQALAPGGECVAVVPRSWTNGTYFRDFRRWAFSVASLDALHFYGSRSEIFSDTKVLQEMMLVRFSKKPQSEFVTVSESHGKDGTPVVRTYPISALVAFDDDLVVRVAGEGTGKGAFDALEALEALPRLKAAGLCASTGKVVDFRSRELLREHGADGCVRLFQPCNFTVDGVKHPLPGGKPQWMDASSATTAKRCVPAGDYVVVKRFSSKEEPRRVKACVLHLDEPAALENHLNVIHAGTPRAVVPLDSRLARGLTAWLSSSDVETWFRARSGSTQVNASDLNAMPVPEKAGLLKLGEAWRRTLSQDETDALCRRALGE